VDVCRVIIEDIWYSKTRGKEKLQMNLGQVPFLYKGMVDQVLPLTNFTRYCFFI
jgi:hypothetical protein